MFNLTFQDVLKTFRQFPLEDQHKRLLEVISQLTDDERAFILQRLQQISMLTARDGGGSIPRRRPQ